MRTRVLPEPAGATMRAGPARVGHRGQLVVGRGRPRAAPGGGGRRVSRPSSTDSRWMTAARRPFGGQGRRGPPSIHARGPSARTHVARAHRRPARDAAPGAGPALRPTTTPARRRAPGVVGVGPHQEVQAVEPELEVGGQAPGLDHHRLGRAEPGRVDRQRRRRPAGARPRPRAGRAPSGRIGQGGLVDRRTVGAGPGPGTGWPSPITTPRPRATGPATVHAGEARPTPVTDVAGYGALGSNSKLAEFMQ